LIHLGEIARVLAEEHRVLRAEIARRLGITTSKEMSMKVIKGKRSKGTSSAKIVGGVAWYYPEQWSRLLHVASDRETLEDRYEDWLCLAEKAMFDLKRSGITPKKVYVDVEKLIEWCSSQNREVDGSARSEFVHKLIEESDTKA
jgi:hypothetical protein